MNYQPRTEYRQPNTAGVTGRRIGAAFLDAIALLIIYYIMAETGGQTVVEDGEVEKELDGIGFLLYVVVVALYYTGSELVYSATPGKLLLALRVFAADGSRPTVREILVRNLFRIVDFLPFFYIVGAILVARSRLRQRLGDMMAGTVVAHA